MKCLLIGSGGREHALAAGIAEVADIVDVKADDMIGLLALVQREAYDFVVVGPEQPLAMGLVDALQENGPNCRIWRFHRVKRRQSLSQNHESAICLKGGRIGRR